MTDFFFNDYLLYAIWAMGLTGQVLLESHQPQLYGCMDGLHARPTLKIMHPRSIS